MTAPPDASPLPDLAAARLGGVAVAANDEFFAPRENLLLAAAPRWTEDYTERGKWMDGWETRRRREPGHDWCLIRLGVPGVVRELVVDTAFFRGNYPESCAVQGCTLSGTPGVDALLAATWHEVLPRAPLAGDSRNVFSVTCPYRFTHLRLEIFPDGGVARLRVHGEPLPDPVELARRGGELDLAGLELGATVPLVSDMFFGSRQNLILPGRSTHMGDGWETRRRRGPGHDWAVIRLATEGEVRRVELDTQHFKGNAPGAARLEGLRAPGEGGIAELADGDGWQELLPRTPLLPDALHTFRDELAALGPLTHVRLSIYPDGGVARLRLWGAPSPAGREALGLRFLNALPPAELATALGRCCAAPEWVATLVAAAPFSSVAALGATADEAWWRLGREQWLTAFAAHPRIGARLAAARTAGWSAREQAGMTDADAAVRARLVTANEQYESRFGYVFLIRATGRTAAEMLAACETRLGNDAEAELGVAAEQHAQITRLRLAKLLGLEV
jgi:allantoicase